MVRPAVQRPLLLYFFVVILLAFFLGTVGSYFTGHVVHDSAYRVTLSPDEQETVFGRPFTLDAVVIDGVSTPGAYGHVGPYEYTLLEGEAAVVDDLLVRLERVDNLFDRDHASLYTPSAIFVISKSPVAQLTDTVGLAALPAPFVRAGRYDHFAVAVAADASAAEREAAIVTSRAFQIGFHPAAFVDFATRPVTSGADHFIVVGLCDSSAVQSLVVDCSSLGYGVGYLGLTSSLREGRDAKYTQDSYLVVTGTDAAGLAKAAHVLSQYAALRLTGTSVVINGPLENPTLLFS